MFQLPFVKYGRKNSNYYSNQNGGQKPNSSIYSGYNTTHNTRQYARSLKDMEKDYDNPRSFQRYFQAPQPFPQKHQSQYQTSSQKHYQTSSSQKLSQMNQQNRMELEQQQQQQKQESPKSSYQEKPQEQQDRVEQEQRRSPSPVQQQQQPQPSPQQQQQPPVQVMIENENQMHISEPVVAEVPDKNTSATEKALKQMEKDGTEKKWKKGVKIPLSVRRQKLNQRLSKILAPKSALILLHELKPGCTYKVQEQMGSNPPLLMATVEHNNVVLGTGQGMSKSQAKNTAAENAIKAIVSKTMTQNSAAAKNDLADNEEGVKMEEDANEDNTTSLPWAGLASFAMYKMFTEWQNQGTDLPLARPATKSKKKVAAKAPAVKKELPENAVELHPSVLLNMMKPGVTAVEVEREPGPKGRVTMGYMIDGEMYKGISGNKKDARKEAAKVVLQSLYGLTYPV